MPHEVFISHSSRDKPAAEAVCTALEALGVDCWMAPRNIPVGSDWADALADAIAGSKIMVLIVSSRTPSSKHVARELRLAASKSIVIVPVRIEDVTPQGGFDYFLGGSQWLDAIPPPVETHVTELAEKIRVILKLPPSDPSKLKAVAAAALHNAAIRARTWRVRIMQFLLVAVGAYFASKTLAHLSGTALWLPKDWRDSIDIIAGALGGAVFVMVRTLLGFTIESRDAEYLPAKRRRIDLAVLLAGPGCFFLTMVTLALFMWLHAVCVRPFDPGPWINAQNVNRSVQNAKDRKLLASTQASEDALNSAPPMHIPWFVDVGRQEVYLPLFFPAEIRDYVVNIHKLRDTDGLSYILDKQPDYLFETIESQGSFQMTFTNWLFLSLDTLMIVFFAIGLAASFDIRSAIGGLLA